MKASGAFFVIADTETTGLERAKGDELVEIGAWLWTYETGIGTQVFETYVDPGRPIPAMASAIHHITARDVAGAPSPDEACKQFERFVFAQYTDAIVAHNAEFDSAFLPSCDLPWLCSKRLAQHVVTDAPAHNNQVLRYHFGGIDLDLRGKAPHRAVADVIVTAFNLKRIFDAYFEAGHPDDLAAMVAFAESPIKLPVWPMGPAESKGKRFEDIDDGLFRWALRLPDLSSDLRYTINLEIERRSGDRRLFG